MDEAATLWILGTMGGLFLAAVSILVKAFFAHTQECVRFRTELGEKLGELRTLPDEMKLIRKHLHDMRNEQLRRSGEG